MSWKVLRPQDVTCFIYHLALVTYPSLFQNSHFGVMPSLLFLFQYQPNCLCILKTVIVSFFPLPNQSLRLLSLYFIFTFFFFLIVPDPVFPATQKAFFDLTSPFPNLQLHFSVYLFIGKMVTARQWCCCMKSVVWRRLHHLIIRIKKRLCCCSRCALAQCTDVFSQKSLWICLAVASAVCC